MHNFYLVLNSQRVEILFDQRAHLFGLIDKNYVRRAARQRFDSHRTCSGTEVKKSRAFDSRRENTEERLAQTVRSRPRLQRRRTLQSPPAKFSGNNAHAYLLGI